MTIEITDVAFSYDPAATPVLADVNLEIGDGEFLVLLGPSGCGKSTLLRLIAGFDRALSGSVAVNGQPITKPGPDRGMVFQDLDSSLYQWLSVRENVEFGLRVTPRGRRRKARAVRMPPLRWSTCPSIAPNILTSCQVV